MQFLVNELSLHGQFSNPVVFLSSIEVLMSLRDFAAKQGRRFLCHSNFQNGQVTEQDQLPKVIGLMDHDKKQSLMAWLTKHGPFWDENRHHGRDEYFEFNDEIVTDTGLGEAAFCIKTGKPSCLVSIVPSNYMTTPLSVLYFKGGPNLLEIPVGNVWELSTLKTVIEESPIPIKSWLQLQETAESRFENFIFADDAFSPLFPHPFKPGVADTILERLRVLHELKAEGNEDGSRSERGNEIYQEHFVGEKAWFSDSSDSEKVEFKNELTFPNPENTSEELFCSWHGKVKTPQYRIHFNWPVNSLQSTFIVYVGPKITRR